MVFPAEATWNQRLKMVRQYRGESQEDVANVLGTTRKMIHLWEKGLSCPNSYSQKRLALWAKEPKEILFKGLKDPERRGRE